MIEIFRALPQYITLNGINYELNTRFNIWLEIIEYLSDSKISDTDKLICLLSSGYKNKIPPDINDAVDGLFYFLSRGKSSQDCSGEALISFSQDEGLIYSSFLQQYHIDLYETDLHWWKFLYLLDSLDENTSLMKIISYRSIDTGKIKDPNMKKFYRKMKNKYRLNLNIDEKMVAEALDSL